ncbi:hypothetical protein VCRA2119O147_70098 [Vibrio crassostreae]|nr:hypothetical protein VCRA2119O145_100051 [Vibrio crassostreae]CAK1703864.1 hypothetical protein VCRA2112O187_1050009 [Vibrio crassostreae]CAK1704780.1 hypothetical protein VCRA2112O189_100123 [Vibrio crassostreae]CAK1705516.1 hypothetical protein VCRA2110O135_100123 [Vibrio crassostreae]CAK1715259.1 hypothetical protein VCRA2113O212_110050 [Vibrio crassostreae]
MRESFDLRKFSLKIIQLASETSICVFYLDKNNRDSRMRK